jgi:serine/threonine-protein kinase
MTEDPKATPSLHPGETLAGRYHLVRLLGEGGMGVVWEGRQITTDKPVAIKVLKGDGGTDAARFLREAKVAAGLAHRNIVQVFDFWELGAKGPVFMVMELLVGESLAAMIERVGRLSLDETLAALVPVASALRAAHAQGVVHRDLKPENVFLARSAPTDPVDVKVVDFGLAKPATPNAQATAVTHTGTVMGTPFYMSPEQVYGEKDVDIRADVWAFGVVMYECLTGKKPFEGDNFGQIFRKITQGIYTPLRQAANDVPLALDSLVQRMLSHDREHRPSMAEVCDTLPAVREASRASVGGTQRLRALSQDSSPPLGATMPASSVTTSPSSPPGRTMIAASTSVREAPRTRAPAIVAGIAGLALLAMGVGALIALKSQPPKRPAVELAPPLLPPVGPEAAAPVTTSEPPALDTKASADAPDASPPPAATRGARPKPTRPSAPTPGTTRDPLSAGRF